MQGILNEFDSQRIANEMIIRLNGTPDPIIEILKPKILPDGNAWICIYGDNLQESVCGCGDTPNEAVQDFTKNYYNQKLHADREPPEPDMSGPDYKEELAFKMCEMQKLK